MSAYLKSLVWFRRDLRDFDHAALYHALKSSHAVYCAFVFDTDILDKLTDKADRRVEFIWESVRELKSALQAKGSDLTVLYGKVSALIPALAKQLGVQAVFTNRDYEPAAIERDTQVAATLSSGGIAFHDFKDQVIFEKDEILSQAGKSYTVFTPYKNAHLKKLAEDLEGFYLKPYHVDHYIEHLAKIPPTQLIPLEELGFQRTNLQALQLPTGMSGGKTLFENFEERMSRYKDARDFPAVKGVSYLSAHLRFGTVSIRHLARQAASRVDTGSQAWLNELIWRDFYFQILYHHPQVAEGHAFKPEYAHIPFPNDVTLFQAWCEGRTGYPLVDAAMRQLNQTGWMHNRLRMVTASFLIKDLLVDWHWGERYFAEKLIDFDLSANNGGWQWAASTGCDAQPYFRIFNPIAQSKKFDSHGKFIRKYVPELALLNDAEIHAPWQIPSQRQRKIGFSVEKDYFSPIVDHTIQHAMALNLYKKIN